MPDARDRSLPEFDELFVVSDLHLGGDPGFQIFRESERLGRFIAGLAEHARGRRVGLVLAGDVFDSLPFLSPGTYVYLDAAGLVRRLADLFPAVFEGLRAFVGKPRRELWVLTGNHDVELALPEAQDALLGALAGSDAARGRVRFRVGGTGLRCRVGGRTVLVTHGNEADEWNQVDYESLRHTAHARALDLPDAAELFRANPGTRLVVDAMNRIKREHPFVDLLKPETEACLKLLMALYPGALVRRAGAAVAPFVAKHRNPPFVLGDDSSVPAAVERDLLAEALARADRPRPSGAGEVERRVERHQAEGLDPLDLVADDDATLGLPGYVADRLLGKSRAGALRAALIGWLGDEHHWRFDDRDDVCRRVLGQLGPGVDAVVTGHTHLARHFDERERRLVYVNTGTWARLIRLSVADLERAGETEMDGLLNALESRDMAALDQATFGSTGPLVQTRAHAAHITPALAELLVVDADGAWTTERGDDGAPLSTPFASLT
jgi:UDP-2,3-diacylglucosamine pyrophosphatase LpxH